MNISSSRNSSTTNLISGILDMSVRCSFRSIHITGKEGFNLIYARQLRAA